MSSLIAEVGSDGVLVQGIGLYATQRIGLGVAVQRSGLGAIQRGGLWVPVQRNGLGAAQQGGLERSSGPPGINHSYSGKNRRPGLNVLGCVELELKRERVRAEKS